ncbi:hypothetical protein BaRGS_00031960, partial [Batillaria attramentaria]
DLWRVSRSHLSSEPVCKPSGHAGCTLAAVAGGMFNFEVWVGGSRSVFLCRIPAANGTRMSQMSLHQLTCQRVRVPPSGNSVVLMGG